MVGTRHAVSDNNSKCGLGMPSPYIPEQQGGKDREAGLKRKTENQHTPSAHCARPPNLEGQRELSVITNFLPLRQGEFRRGGGMMKTERCVLARAW